MIKNINFFLIRIHKSNFSKIEMSKIITNPREGKLFQSFIKTIRRVERETLKNSRTLLID